MRSQQTRQSQLMMDSASSVTAQSPQQAPQYARQPPTWTMKNQAPKVVREMSFHPFQICCHLISWGRTNKNTHLVLGEPFITSVTSTQPLTSGDSIIQISNHPHSHRRAKPTLSPPRALLIPKASDQLRCPSLAFHPFIYILMEIWQLALAAGFKARTCRWFTEGHSDISTSHSPTPPPSRLLWLPVGTEQMSSLRHRL